MPSLFTGKMQGQLFHPIKLCLLGTPGLPFVQHRYRRGAGVTTNGAKRVCPDGKSLTRRFRAVAR